MKAFLGDEAGVTAVEYGLLAALIAVAIIGAATTLGLNIANRFTAIGTSVGT